MTLRTESLEPVDDTRTGHRAEAEEARARKRALADIRWVLAAIGCPIQISPRASRAAALAAIPFLVGFVGGLAKWPSWLSVTLLVAGLAIYVVVWVSMPKETWTERVLKSLRVYQPLDHGAYQGLLVKIAKGQFNLVALSEWVAAEWRLLERQSEVAAEGALLSERRI